ncbi:MBL fold metallo-hydrolase [Arthrobacter sp. SDTb3-6]|uniref:MBL fold metallo-hydrolase n=1 Tax=Arthrobacter sp. SDTb3-6 TaxID=2713571 RepID=UPI00159E1B33|nr:MBL fold metallo-hydrolase [Arthrobacter sp. SDTb3-6]NVN00675.1 MBL fold metallo-hydrolase [Arthrobacter sp. SDTb3-6]
MNSTAQPQECADGVFLVAGPASNWIILREGREFTVIDSGYPGDRADFIKSIRQLGLEPRNMAALLITHGHVDHTGSARMLSDGFGVPVLSAAAEQGQMTGRDKNQVSPRQILVRAWRPRVFRWTRHIVAAGGANPTRVPGSGAFTDELLAGLPGSPRALATAGHTPGHTAFLLPSGCLATGDALVTGHPLSTVDGPQRLHPMFDHDRGRAGRSLDRLLEGGATTILPGHGKVLAMPIAEAVARARQAPVPRW